MPAPPRMVFKILELTRNPECDVARVADVIGRDGGLTAALITRLLDELVSRIQNTAGSLSVELGPMDQMQANLDALVRELPDAGKHTSFRPMPCQ